MDALIGGIILAIGLTVVLTTASYAMSRQSDAEYRLTAAWLADELMSMVLVEGPDEYKRAFDLSGRFDGEFEDFDYEISIDNPSRGYPYTVVVNVGWRTGGSRHFLEVDSRIAPRLGEYIEPYLREPLEPLDREARYFDEEEEAIDAP